MRSGCSEKLVQALEQSATRGGAALLTVSRLEGTFGLAGLSPGASPAAGALAGMCKTAGHEWKGVECKAVDLAAGSDSAAHSAEMIVRELLRRGPSEVGLSREGRVAITLEPLRTGGGSAERGQGVIEPGDLVVISGGARGVTAEVAVALAEAFAPRLVLLGRSPVPSVEPEWLAPLLQESEIKRALLDRSGGRRTLQDVGEETARIQAQREIRHQLKRIENAGAPAVYRSVDVRDTAAVRTVMDEIQNQYGAVRALIHGAGVLADRRIVDQTDAQFDLVYHTKVNGLQNLYQAIDPEALRLLILFSSSTARFGRAGQVAYAAANEVLNKWAQQQSVRLAHCRVIAYNWGPWSGGMVKDSLKPMFQKEGLSLIPLDAGARLVVEGVRQAAPGPVEVVVLAEPLVAAPPSPARSEPDTPRPAHPEQKLDTVFRRAVNVQALPVLASHVIDGHAVLPMAIIMEWLAEGAVHRNPGLVVCGVDQLKLHKGLIVDSRHSAHVEVRAGKAARDGSHFVVPVELRGTLPNGREVAHARASVVLGEHHDHDKATMPLTDARLPEYRLSREVIYETILFHGPAMQGILHVEGVGERMVAGRVAVGPAPSEWLDRPVRKTWLTEPLAIDSAFQLVVLWSRERFGANSLPTAIGRYRQFRRVFPADGVRVLVEIRHSSEARAVADIEFRDAQGQLVARLDSYECVIDASLNQAFRRNQVGRRLTLSHTD